MIEASRHFLQTGNGMRPACRVSVALSALIVVTNAQVGTTPDGDKVCGCSPLGTVGCEACNTKSFHQSGVVSVRDTRSPLFLAREIQLATANANISPHRPCVLTISCVLQLDVLRSM